MSEIRNNLRYTSTHEWIRVDEDGLVTVGISDFAQSALGDVVFVELPEIDGEVDAEQDVAVVESVKAASDIYAPVAGVIAEINESVAEDPSLLNADPYGEGWIFKLRVDSLESFDDLLGADEYQEHCQAEDQDH
ncbi:MAG: glycine cleavage system protein GcvH [Gammaproteobacteria bacterium]|nr:glycine cleavage system protein GcvH [Gammaproteobacteria bacterium]MXX94494.1 glycine cleavage system protein GcvH [Gammaproteobacteria bacterium]MYF52602.1 glycine cleavage system protein GcvH [Gammaproteobacteria bacterium]MYK43232.1 glycine cleavage system protein GcvH [Gammaproteobacteria bacterium]